MEHQNTPPENHTTHHNPGPVKGEKVDVLGIISVMCASFGFAPLGLIFGLVGVRKAKREGYNPIISRIGWIISLVFTILIGLVIGLIILLFAFAANRSHDVTIKNDINQLNGELSAYYSSYGYYPANLSALNPNLNRTDPNGLLYVYVPTPTDCVECTGYTLQGTLGNGTVYKYIATDAAPTQEPDEPALLLN